MAYLGDIKTALSYEVQRQGPLDYRLSKKKKEDLINVEKWPHETTDEGKVIPYAYKTMLVGIEETGEVYKLKDLTKMFEPDYSGWELLESNSGGSGVAGTEEIYIGEEEPTDENIKVWYNPEESSEDTPTANITVDTVMSDISDNPVANKTIKAYIDDNSIILDNLAPGIPGYPGGEEVQLTNGEYQKILSYLVNNKDKSKSIVLNMGGGGSYTPISIEVGGENNETITMTFIMFGQLKYVLVLTVDSENPNNCTATGTIFSITGSTKLHLDSAEVFNNPGATFEDKWNVLPEDTSYILLSQNEAEPYLLAAKRCKFPGGNGERAILTKEVMGFGGTNSILTESGKVYAIGLMPDLGYSSGDGSGSYGEDITKYIDIQLSELSSVGESWRMDSLKVGVYDVHWSTLKSTYFLQNTVFDLSSRTFSNFTAETSDIKIKNSYSSFNFNIYKFLTNFSYTNNNDITFIFGDISLRALQVQIDSDTQFTLVFKDFINGKTGIMVVTEETTTLTVSSDNA